MQEENQKKNNSNYKRIVTAIIEAINIKSKQVTLRNKIIINTNITYMECHNPSKFVKTIKK